MSEDLSKKVTRELKGPVLYSLGLDSAMTEAMRRAVTFPTWDRWLEPYGKQVKAALDQMFRPLAVQADIFHGLSKSLAGAFSPMQSIIDQTKWPAELTANLASSLEFRFDLSRLTAQQLNFTALNLSDAITKAMSVPRILQSPEFTALAARMQRDAEFRNRLMQELGSFTGSTAIEDDVIPSEQEVLSAIQTGIEACGLRQDSATSETVLKRFFDWLRTLRKPLGVVVCGVIIGVILLHIEYTYYAQQKSGSPEVPERERVRLIRRVTERVRVEKKIPVERWRAFRFVAKDGLAIHRNKRLDSERLVSLSVGDVVLVKHVSKNWCQVGWLDTTSDEWQTGWTLTRYLERLR